MLKNGISVSVLLAGVAYPLSAVEAITIRGDQAPTGIGDYWDGANSLPNVANIGTVSGGSVSNSCTGTLINARTILTAAHCFTDRPGGLANPLVYNFTQLGNTVITFANDSVDADPIEISGAYAHANYNGDATDDIAVIALDRPVTDLTPVILTSAAPSVGDVIFVSGYGTSGVAGVDPVVLLGDGSLSFTNNDGKRRIAFNYVDFAGTLPDGAQLLVFDMDDPANPTAFSLPGSGASNTPVHAFEGSSSFGDSGGPMFLRLPDGTIVQVGVSQGGDDPNDVGDGNYTGISTYTNMVPYLTWIAENNPLRKVSVTGSGNWDDPSLWSEGVVPDENLSMVPGETRYYNVNLSQPGTVTLDSRRTVDQAMLSGGTLHISSTGQLVLEVGLTVGAASMARVDGFTFGDHEILAGGMLGGTGTLGGDVVNRGVLAPGNSIGELTISGDLTLGPAGQLLIEVAGTSSDRLTVSGDAFLAGGLTISAPGLDTPDGAQLTFLTANTVSGAFGSVNTESLFYSGAVTIGATDVMLHLSRKATLGDLAGQQGRSQLGDVLEDISGTLSPTLRAALTALAAASSVGELNETLRQLSGENHGLDPALGVRGAQAVNALVASRLAGLSGGGAAGLASLREGHLERIADQWGAAHGPNTISNPLRALIGSLNSVTPDEAEMSGLDANGSRVRQGGLAGAWFEGFRTAGDVEATAKASGVGYEINGTTAGYDAFVSANLLIGGGVGHTKTTTSIVTGLGDQSVTRGVHALLYGRYDLGDAFVSASVNHTRSRTEARRFTAIGGGTQSAVSTYKAQATSVGASYVRPQTWAEFDIYPSVSLSYVHQSTDGYQESGSAALLSVEARSSNSLNAGAAVRVASDWSLEEDLTLTPEIRAGVICDLFDEDPSATARFLGTGAGFQTRGAETDRGGALLGAGAVLSVGDDVQFYADYDGYFADAETAHTVLAGFRARF